MIFVPRKKQARMSSPRHTSDTVTLQKMTAKGHAVTATAINTAPNFSQFLSQQIKDATLASWSPDSGKNTTYPSSVTLATTKGQFGGISPNHSFIKEPCFENIVILILKSAFLSHKDHVSLVQSSPAISTLWNHMVSLRNLDFSPLQEIDKDYINQSSVPSKKTDMFLACALFYNLDLASVIRYTGGNYTAAHQDVDAITSQLTSAQCDPSLVAEIRRILTVGCPAYFNAESSNENFKLFFQHGNHSTIATNIAKVMKTINKETQHCYVIPFPRWLARLCPNIHLTPQGLLIKAGKKDRMIWDGSFLPTWYATCINMMQDPSKSPDIHFGTAFMRHLVRIWNLRITHPHKEIYVWDDDVSGAYRVPKYHPNVAGAFAYAILNFLFLPTGGTFGSNTSPQEYEPFARARAFLAEHLSRDESLVLKHLNILSLVEFDEETDPTSVSYVQATADALHQGVYNSTLGRDVNTPHNPFVDDTLMADIRRHMLTCMAASIEALFIILGRLSENERRSPLSMDKFAEFHCSWRKQQLGLLLDTRKMTVALPEDKFQRMYNTLTTTWHHARKSFTLLEGVTLLGHLEHACTVCPWGRHLFCAIRSAVNHCIRNNMRNINTLSHLSTMASTIRDAKTDDEKVLFDRFVQKKISKSLYGSKKPCFISVELRAEINFITHIVRNPTTFKWEAPIAHLVPRTHDYGSWGDSSLYAGGGFSLDLHFWWYINWPLEIQCKTVKYFTVSKQDPSSGELVSINLLEFAVVIINYAAATHALSLSPPSGDNPYPTLLNWSDNMSANSWCNKAASSNLASRSLSRLLCSLRINNSLGLNTDFIPGIENIVADTISRLHPIAGSAPDFSILFQEFPGLRTCRRFQPSAKLLSDLMHALLTGLNPGIPQAKTLGHFSPAKDTI